MRFAARCKPGLYLPWVLAATIAAAADAATVSTPDESRLGQALFSGEMDLQGRIRTHLVELRADVVRCGNCHAVQDGPDVPRSLAPRLTRELLLEPQVRRGGPISSYRLDSFCRLLRQGIDPAYVLVSLEMPVYEMDENRCRALWQFLTVNPNATTAH